MAGKESQREQEEVETLALKCCFFLLFPQPCSQRREVWGGQWEDSKEQTIPAIPWWAGGQTPPHSICLCCSRCHPACQPVQPSRLGSQAVPAPAQLGVGVGHSLGSVKGSAALFYFSLSPLCFQGPGLSQPWGSGSVLCQPQAVSSIPASLPPPARGLLPALGSGSVRPCQPQLLRVIPRPRPHSPAHGWRLGPRVWRSWLSAMAALGPGSPTLFPTRPSPLLLSPVIRVFFPPLCFLPAQDSLLPSRPWLEAHNETASPNRLGGGESPWQPKKPLLPPSPSSPASLKGLKVWRGIRVLRNTGWRMTREQE